MSTLTPLLAPAAEPDASDQQRTDVRSNMFIAATLYDRAGSMPVRLRNMSRSGALIEGAALPSEGAQVRLCRGSLAIAGHVAWQRDNRAGIRFDGSVEVGDWLPRGRPPTGQEQVDAMVHACRSAPAATAPIETAPPAATGNAEAIRQLLDVRDALNAAAEELAGDAGVAAAHAGALQAIDAIAQRLGRVAEGLAAPAQIPPATGA